MAIKLHKIRLDSHDVFISQRGRTDNFKVVKPYINEDGSINWFNLLTGGSWWNLVITAVIVIVVLGVLYEYSLNIQTLLDCFQVPGKLQACVDRFGYGQIGPGPLINPYILP